MKKIAKLCDKLEELGYKGVQCQIVSTGGAFIHMTKINGVYHDKIIHHEGTPLTFLSDRQLNNLSKIILQT